MFCDLVGSTALSARLDPEDLQELLQAYHARVGDVAGRHGGFVAKYLGDGALIYFGYPQAHENDAERAVRAGLALVDGVSELTAAGEHLSARVGIATGLVVVGRSCRRGRGAGARDSGRDAQSCGPAPGAGRARCGGHRRHHAAASRRPVRARHASAVRAQGLRRTGAGLAGDRRGTGGKSI